MTTTASAPLTQPTPRRTRPAWLDFETAVFALMVVLVTLTVMNVLPWEVGLLEAGAVVTGAASVWLLARNSVWGWWIGIVSVILFGALFMQVALYAEVGIQGFYLITSIQAIWLWVRAGARGDGRPVTHLPRRHWLWIVPVFAASWIALHWVLVAIDGALPFWDSLTTMMSLTAHLLLMGRFVNAWWIWIAVDVIYVPLYLSRGLSLTAVLYVGFLVMATAGLIRFQRLARKHTTADA